MRSSNPRDKNSTTYSQQNATNKLMKTQLPPKNNRESLNSTEYRTPVASNKKIDSVKSINDKSTKPMPAQNRDFDIENNMTESKIYVAKESLQLLKKRMNKTGMSREKASTHQLEEKQETPQVSMKKIKPKESAYSNKNIENYKPIEEYQEKRPPVRKPMERKPVSQKVVQQPPKEKFQEVQEVPISQAQDFNAILERQLRNQGGTNQLAMQPYEDDQNIEMQKCSRGCGRMFNVNVLAKHEKVCEKVFQSKRKAFNTAEQRKPQGQGITMTKPPTQTSKLGQTKKNESKAQKVPEWKIKSAQFRMAMKQVNGKAPSKEEQELVKMQQDNQIQCKTCGRKFNETAGKRHIEFCQNKAKQMPKMNVSKRK